MLEAKLKESESLRTQQLADSVMLSTPLDRGPLSGGRRPASFCRGAASILIPAIHVSAPAASFTTGDMAAAKYQVPTVIYSRSTPVIYFRIRGQL